MIDQVEIQAEKKSPAQNLSYFKPCFTLLL